MFSERRETVWIHAVLTKTRLKKKKKKGRREVVEFLKQTYVVLNKTIKTP